jgi:predicted amidophosphoribosyltransferase
MSAEQRRSIVEGAFAADPAQVEWRRVLLVDDVATTGATLDACATALLEAGAASVRCVTFARAD